MTGTKINPEDRAAIALVDKVESEHPPMDALLKVERKLLSAAGTITSEPIATDCHSTYHAAHTSGTRPLREIDLIVVHSTEGGTARSVAMYFKGKDSGGSAHLVVDDNSCYRCLSDAEIPWGAPGANYHGFHIEQCGYAKWTTVLWSNTHRKTLMRSAYKAAYHCRKYGIAVRFLSAANLKAGSRNGITTHNECSVAFGGNHHDPGTGWPRVLYMTMVRAYYTSLWRMKPAV